MSTPPTKMHDFCEITSSKRIFASEYMSNGVPFYRSKEIIEKQSGKLNVSTEIFISESRFEEISGRFGAPLEGDILLTSVGTLGVPYVVQKDERFYFKDGNLTWFRNFSGLDSDYLYYWLLSPIGKAELKKATIGSSQSAYTINLLGGLSISPHEIDEQRKIARLLRTYDDLITANQRRIQLLEESARLLYREWFVKLRFPEHKTPPVRPEPVEGRFKALQVLRQAQHERCRVPDGWEKKTLGDYITLNYGKGLKETDRIDGDFPVYGSSGIVGYHNKPLIAGPAIIVGRKGNVGSVYYSHCPCFPIDTVYFISSEQTSYFLYLALQGLNFISSDAAVPGLNRNYAYSQQLLLPSPEVLAAFEAMTRPIFEQTNALVCWNEKLRETRDLLLPKLMSGALDVSRITLPEEVAA